MIATDDTGRQRTLKVDEDGALIVSGVVGGGGGGGGGDASAANQDEQTALLTAIDGHVDGLEANTASTNTKLDTLHTDLASIDGHVDGLEASATSTNTKLDTLHSDLVALAGYVDGLEGFVDGLETLIGSTNTKLDSLIAAGGGATKKAVACSFTRPANATAYPGGKVLADSTSAATMLKFANAAVTNGGSFRINKLIWVDDCTNASGSDNYDFAMHLFTAAFATPLNDGANMDFTYAQMQTSAGYIPLLLQTALFTANVTAGENVGSSGKRMAYIQNLDELVVCDPSSKDIFFVLETLHAWTPVSGEKFTLIIVGEAT